MAERALLGGLLVDGSAINEVAPIVRPVDFYLDSNGLIYQTMLDLSAKSEPADIITIMAELRKHGRADIGEGQDKAEAYLLGLVERVPTSQNARTYAQTIADMAQRRRLINSIGKVATRAWDQSEDMTEILADAQAAVFQASSNGKEGRKLGHISAGLHEYIEQMEQRFANPVDVAGISTGLVDIDKLLNGLKRQELMIVAGRPGMGKTGLLMSMIMNMTIKGSLSGAVFSLEMSKDELRNRLIANVAKVDLQNLNRGKLTEQQKHDFYEATGHLSEARLYINDLPGLSPEEILMDARRVASRVGLDYIMLDYLGLIDVPGAAKRYEAVSKAARSLKNLAKDINVPVVAAAQLSRSVEYRGSRRPILSDLRDSGEIEEAADVVLFLYRDEYYDDASTQPNQGEAIVAKQRNGPTGHADLYWRDYSASYHNLERREVSF
jgi:replicative DNA helicase